MAAEDDGLRTSTSWARADNLPELERLLSSRAYEEAQASRHEWWCLCRVLCHSNMRFKIKFPAKIEKTDPPDFLIEHGCQQSEVEITRATFQRYEQVKEKWREAGHRGLLELDMSLFDNRVLKKQNGRDEWRQWAREPGEKLVGRGGVGGEREQSLTVPDIDVNKVCELVDSKMGLALHSFDAVAVVFGGEKIRLWDRASR